MKLIIDTDPGTDDAVAILIALAHFTDDELLGITTVAGNVKVDVGTRNALRILNMLAEIKYLFIKVKQSH